MLADYATGSPILFIELSTNFIVLFTSSGTMPEGAWSLFVGPLSVGYLFMGHLFVGHQKENGQQHQQWMNLQLRSSTAPYLSN